jgi:hypothetical protein
MLLRGNSGSLAMLAAMRRASSQASIFAADRRLGWVQRKGPRAVYALGVRLAVTRFRLLLHKAAGGVGGGTGAAALPS